MLLREQGPYFIFLKRQEYLPFPPMPNDMIQYLLIGCLIQDEATKSLEALDDGDDESEAHRFFHGVRIATWCRQQPHNAWQGRGLVFPQQTLACG